MKKSLAGISLLPIAESTFSGMNFYQFAVPLGKNSSVMGASQYSREEIK